MWQPYSGEGVTLELTLPTFEFAKIQLKKTVNGPQCDRPLLGFRVGIKGSAFMMMNCHLTRHTNEWFLTGASRHEPLCHR
jgi:hypothetical protein